MAGVSAAPGGSRRGRGPARAARCAGGARRRHRARGRGGARRTVAGAPRQRGWLRGPSGSGKVAHDSRAVPRVHREAAQDRSPLPPRRLAAPRHRPRPRAQAARHAADLRSRRAVRPALRRRALQLPRGVPQGLRHHAVGDADRGGARAHRVRAGRGRVEGERPLPRGPLLAAAPHPARAAPGGGGRGGHARAARRQAPVRHPLRRDPVRDPLAVERVEPPHRRAVRGLQEPGRGRLRRRRRRGRQPGQGPPPGLPARHRQQHLVHRPRRRVVRPRLDPPGAAQVRRPPHRPRHPAGRERRPAQLRQPCRRARAPAARRGAGRTVGSCSPAPRRRPPGPASWRARSRPARWRRRRSWPAPDPPPALDTDRVGRRRRRHVSRSGAPGRWACSTVAPRPVTGRAGASGRARSRCGGSWPSGAPPAGTRRTPPPPGAADRPWPPAAGSGRR